MDYFLIENHLTPDPDDRTAIPTNVPSYNDEQLIARMMKRGTTLTYADLQAAITLYREEHGYVIEEGGAINTGLMQAVPAFKGKFNNAVDSYDPARHKFYYNLTLAQPLKAKTTKLKFNKVQAPATGPVITMVWDSASKQTDGTMTPGGVLDIQGLRLKIFPEVPGNGVFFVAADGTEYQAEILVENKPSRIIAMIPTLPQGEYALEVRTNLIGTNRAGNQLRKAVYRLVMTMGS